MLNCQNSDREFTNTSGAADGVASRIFDKLSGVTFTQDDAGKTFSYVLSEAAGNLPGVTYSKDTYRFDITVVDNGDGTNAYRKRKLQCREMV